jgi:hypothetical protein
MRQKKTNRVVQVGLPLGGSTAPRTSTPAQARLEQPNIIPELT